jgi:two-component sensor histidine kinase
MFDLVHPEDAEALIERAKKVIAERRPHATYQFRAFTKDGELLWIESYASYLYRNDGSLDCIVATEREITERKRTEERLERAAEEMQRLMAELNHRVKNNLAMVRSHIRLKDDRLGETADLSDLDARIRAILGVHERLQNTSSVTHVPFRRYVEDLLADVFTQWSGPRVRLDIRVEDIHLPARTAVSLGLVLTELATNAMKHGFDDEELPVFSVSCSRSDGDGHCVLTVSNSGRPLPADLDMESPETLGLQLVTSSIRSHGGTIEVEGAPQPVFRIRVPLEEGHARRGRS